MAMSEGLAIALCGPLVGGRAEPTNSGICALSGYRGVLQASDAASGLNARRRGLRCVVGAARRHQAKPVGCIRRMHEGKERQSRVLY